MAVSVYTGAGGGVASFNGRKGNVVPANGDYTKAQVGLSNVDNVKQYSESNPPPYPVTSVAGKTGAVTLAASDVGLGNVDNTSDANKPISNATQAALNDKQSKITANGILKGDGSGNITAASETEVELVSLPNICNPNLLDNWYFGNPVNQRGQTSYTGAMYGIDRWKLQYDTTLTVGNGFCTLHGSWDIRQILENLPKATYTASILFKNSTANALQIFFQEKTGSDISVAISHDASGLLVGTMRNIDLSSFALSLSGSGSVDIIAIKLELGSQQTLAHQENGAWVLNEIPDYGEQLRRCQRYAQNGYFYTVIGQLTYAGTAYVIPLRFTQDMRAAPAITVKEISAYGWGNVPISSAEIIWNTKYGAFVAITDLSAKENYIGKACYVYYFASADL